MSEEKAKEEAYLGNDKKLTKGEYLEFDNRAYDMLHRMTTEWPCLSVDFIVGENPFENRNLKYVKMEKYPYEIYTVQGTQAEQHNQLYISKWSKLHKTKYDDDSEDCEDE
jgi:ribosome assembly protein RRB1